MNETPTPSSGADEPRRPDAPQPYQPYEQPAPAGQPAPPPRGPFTPPGGDDQPTGVFGFGPPGPPGPPGPAGPTSGGGSDAPKTGKPAKRRRTVAGVAALALAAGLIGGGAGAAGTYFATTDDQNQTSTVTPDEDSSSTAPNTNTSVSLPPGDVQQIAEQVRQSVVSITIVTSMGSGGGSGVILTADGLILTNNHVVASTGDSGRISVTFDDGTTASAEVVGQDPVTDIAVIKVDGVSDLQPATFGESGNLAVGQDVIAIGSPLGLSGTVTTGIVSALQRPVLTGETEIGGEASSTVIDAIQTDAAINPGNSGGALVDAAGRVVGINSAIATTGEQAGGQSGSIGLGFAIPIDQAKPIADQLIEDGNAEHAQLGVSVATETDERDGITSGAGVAEVTAGGAAEDAGLQQGDIVTKIDDRAILDANALIAAVRSYQPDDEVTITYLRDGDEHTTTATLGTDGGQTSVPEQPGQQDDPQRGPWDDFPWGN